MTTKEETEAQLTQSELTQSELNRLPAVQALLAIEQPARVTRPTLSVVRSAPSMPAVEEAAPLHPVAHWVLMPTGGGHAQLDMVWETPDPLPPTDTH